MIENNYAFCIKNGKDELMFWIDNEWQVFYSNDWRLFKVTDAKNLSLSFLKALQTLMNINNWLLLEKVKEIKIEFDKKTTNRSIEDFICFLEENNNLLINQE
jgi:hypothetical protein